MNCPRNIQPIRTKHLGVVANFVLQWSWLKGCVRSLHNDSTSNRLGRFCLAVSNCLLPHNWLWKLNTVKFWSSWSWCWRTAAPIEILGSCSAWGRIRGLLSFSVGATFQNISELGKDGDDNDNDDNDYDDNNIDNNDNNDANNNNIKQDNRTTTTRWTTTTTTTTKTTATVTLTTTS